MNPSSLSRVSPHIRLWLYVCFIFLGYKREETEFESLYNIGAGLAYHGYSITTGQMNKWTEERGQKSVVPRRVLFSQPGLPWPRARLEFLWKLEQALQGWGCVHLSSWDFLRIKAIQLEHSIQFMLITNNWHRDSLQSQCEDTAV